MIGRIQGVVVETRGEVATLDVHGVGYEVVCSRALLAECSEGQEKTVLIHTDVREDSIRLYGFVSHAEKQVFLLLNRVSGLGPRSSLDVISHVSIRELLRAIGSGDVNSLMKIKGVGKKKAERMIVELRDLVGTLAEDRSSSLREMVSIESSDTPGGSHSNGVTSDAVAALGVLGFPTRDAQAAVERAVGMLGTAQDVGNLVREALKHV